MSPAEVIRRELSRSRRDDARLAGMILLAEPERIGDEPIGEFLLRIKCIERETVAGWLQRSGVNPWRPCTKLTAIERRLIAGQLARFAKGVPERAA